MGRLVVDITELAHWSGQLTGVPRVMNELSYRLSNREDVEFVAWSKHKGRLESVEYVPRSTEATENDPSLPKEGALESVKVLIRKSKTASRAVEVIKGGAVSIKNGSFELSRAHTRFVPHDDDTFFILADWHGSDPNFIAYVESLKSQSQGLKIIQMAYDMLPAVAPQYSGHSTKFFVRYVQRVYPIVDQIIAISECTKKDIISYLHDKELSIPPIGLIRLGDDFRISKPILPKKKVLKSVSHGEEFILCVGTIEARKNHTLLYYGYKYAISKGIELPKLVIVGRIGWLAHDIYTVISEDPALKDKVIFMQNISDGELAWLYAHCLFSVYPSLYEGWGLPVAESIAHDVPCLASNTSSIPEIAGGLLSYFSPYSPENLVEHITYLMRPTHLAEAKRKLKKYKMTTWDSSYEAVSDIIEAVHEK